MSTLKTEVKKDELKEANKSSIKERLSKLDNSKFERKIHLKEKMYSFEYKGLNFEDQKKKRQKIRNQLKRFVNHIIIDEKTSNVEQQKTNLIEFKTFYKDNYIKNDLSVSSIYKGSNNEFKEELLLMLEIVKTYISKI